MKYIIVLLHLLKLCILVESFNCCLENNECFLDMRSCESIEICHHKSEKKDLKNPISSKKEIQSITIFTDVNEFDLLCTMPSLILEDFEDGNVPDGGTVGCGDPLDNTPSQCFTNGIDSGLSLSSSSQTNIVALGSGIAGIGITVAADLFADTVTIDFLNDDITAVKLNAIDLFGGMINMEIVGIGGNLLTAMTLGNQFNGGIISSDFIKQIKFPNPSNVMVFQYIEFGSCIPPMGACCANRLSNPTACYETDETTCVVGISEIASAGQYKGDDILCSDVKCPCQRRI